MTLPANPIRWIESLDRPTWDAYFMAMVFLVATRSPDQETKQGCVIVDWNSKLVLSTGYNGHPRGSVLYLQDEAGNTHYPSGNAASGLLGNVQIHELPTKRPGKYACMVHADTNAAVNCNGRRSDNAVVYLPMPPCEMCLGVLANMSDVKVRRIVYLEHRDFPNTFQLLKHLPHITFEKYQGPHPAEVLEIAATYSRLRTQSGVELSKNSATTYS